MATRGRRIGNKMVFPHRGGPPKCPAGYMATNDPYVFEKCKDTPELPTAETKVITPEEEFNHPEPQPEEEFIHPESPEEELEEEDGDESPDSLER